MERAEEEKKEAEKGSKESAPVETSTQTRSSKRSAPITAKSSKTSKLEVQASSKREKRSKTKATRAYASQKDEEKTESDEGVKEIKKQKKKGSGKPSTGQDKEEMAEECVEKPTLSLKSVIKSITVDGNLQPMAEFYDDYNEADQKILQEATIMYLNIYNKDFIEIISLIPKSLEKELEIRKNNAMVKDIEIQE